MNKQRSPAVPLATHTSKVNVQERIEEREAKKGDKRDGSEGKGVTEGIF